VDETQSDQSVAQDPPSGEPEDETPEPGAPTTDVDVDVDTTAAPPAQSQPIEPAEETTETGGDDGGSDGETVPGPSEPQVPPGTSDDDGNDEAPEPGAEPQRI
jgi:hypothetical protein